MKKPLKILPPDLEPFDNVPPREAIITAAAAICVLILVVGLTYLSVVD